LKGAERAILKKQLTKIIAYSKISRPIKEAFMSENKGISVTFIIVLFITLFFCFGFGINALYLTEKIFHFTLGLGKFWTITVILSVALYVALFFIRKKEWKKAVVAYLIVNLAIAGVDIALYFLFDNHFLKELVYAAFRIKF
jgi:hypothetical protein